MDIEDDFIINVAVFAVPKAEKEAIQDAVYDLCDSLLDGTGYLSGVTVRDVERTRQYYPEFLPSPPPVSLSQLMSHQELLTGWEYTEVFSYMPPVATQYTKIPDFPLALAA